MKAQTSGLLALYAVLIAAILIGVGVPVIRETIIGLILASLLVLDVRRTLASRK